MNEDKTMKYTRELMIERFDKGERFDYVFFWRHFKSDDNIVTKSCLSQWYDCCFTIDGVEYRTAEQYMMAQKAVLFGDEKVKAEIMAADNPQDYKALGRKIVGFSGEIWAKHRCDVVVRGNIAKFSQNEELREFLLNTGTRVLVEASPYDKI